MADDPVVTVVTSVRSFIEKVVKKLALDVTANLIETTPVDTGWARANWVPQIGTPFDGNLDFDHSLENRKGKSEAVGGQLERQGVGIASITSFTLPEKTINITNNVPYIERLNEGWSRQAPAAFVQAAIARAVEQNISPLTDEGSTGE